MGTPSIDSRQVGNAYLQTLNKQQNTTGTHGTHWRRVVQFLVLAGEEPGERTTLPQREIESVGAMSTRFGRKVMSAPAVDVKALCHYEILVENEIHGPLFRVPHALWTQQSKMLTLIT